jgi:hypothetical protein
MALSTENQLMEDSPKSTDREKGRDSRRFVAAIRRVLRRVDNWVSDGVEARQRGGQSGWYVHSGEGKAIAAGARARNGAEADISKMLRSRESRLAIRAIQLATPPPNGNYEDYLDAVSGKYSELLSGKAESDEQAESFTKPPNAEATPEQSESQ